MTFGRQPCRNAQPVPQQDGWGTGRAREILIQRIKDLAKAGGQAHGLHGAESLPHHEVQVAQLIECEAPSFALGDARPRSR